MVLNTNLSSLSPVPCTPTNVSVSVQCSQDSARVNWTTSIGAIFYIAVAQDTNGNSYSCNSMGTNCLLQGLQCGQNYTAHTIGTNLKCNSSSSNVVTFTTGSLEGRVTLKWDFVLSISSFSFCIKMSQNKSVFVEMCASSQMFKPKFLCLSISPLSSNQH